MNQMLDQILTSLKEVDLEKFKEVAAIKSKMTNLLLQELLLQEFTREEAIQIICSGEMK